MSHLVLTPQSLLIRNFQGNSNQQAVIENAFLNCLNYETPEFSTNKKKKKNLQFVA